MSIARFYQRQTEPILIESRKAKAARFLQQMLDNNVISSEEASDLFKGDVEDLNTVLKAAYAPGATSSGHLKVESLETTMRLITFGNPHLKKRT